MKRTLDFEPTGFFAFRTPLLPWEELTAWNEGLRASAAHADAGDVADALAADRQLLRQRLVELIERPEIREALFVAAPALDIGVEAWRRDAESKKGRRAEESLVRYFLRMTTRPTPFGLFSGCSVGSLGEATRLDLVERGDYQRHTRLDTDYLFALCGVLGQDDEIRRLLRYRPNTSLYHAAGRLRYAESRLHGRTRVHHLVAVDVDDYLELTLRRAANGAALEDLAGALVAADPDGEIEQDEAEEYVGELIDAQVLLSDLSPVVTGSESIHDLLDQLDELPAAASVQAGLAAARDALATLDDAGLGNEPESYRAVATGLEELPAKVDLPRLFQVDMTKPAPEALLGPKVIEEIERGLAILQRLDESPREDAFSQFRDNFIERYGDARRVPLFSVLDEEVGIGYSGSQSSDASPLLAGLRLPGVPQDRTIGWGPRTEMLFEKLEQALASGAHEITLSKKDLAKLESREGRPLPDGFQVMAAVAAESAEAIDRGDFQLHLRSAYGPSGAQLLGRFCHADETLQQRVEEHLRREEAMRPEAIFAEIVHLPEGRIGNILARPVLRQHEIPFLGRSGADAEHQIPVKDLLVSVVGQEIQLYSARLGRRVFPRMATAHNYSSRSLGVYRFLCSLQMQGLTSNLMWTWGGLDSAAFLPRVRSGRLVLSRARWKITRDEIRKLADKKDAARFEAVQAWRSRRRLPGRVVLQDGDNELLVDLDNILSIDTFLAVVKNRPSCTLAELFPDPEQLCIGSTEGRFVHEIVVPFLRRAPQQPQGEKIQPRSAAEPQQATAPQGEAAAAPTPPAPGSQTGGQRTFLPGSEWLYAKLYTGTATADQLLVQVVRPVVQQALSSGAADGWFFIRYGDPKWHLRLRFHGEPQRLQGEVLPLLHRALAPLANGGWLWGVQLDTYEREVERYGGLEGTEVAERLFRIDSEAVVELLANLEGDEGAVARWQLTLKGIDQLFADLGFDAAAKLTILKRMASSWAREHRVDGGVRKQLANKLRQERDEIESLLQESPGDEHPLAPGFAILDRRSERLAPIRDELQALEKAGRLSPPLSDLVSSYIHMFTNRMLRSQGRAHEMVLYDFLHRINQSRAARKK